MIAGAAVSATNSAASVVITQIIIRLMNGNFNPNYSKENRRKMRYIQRKYASAYQTDDSSGDPLAVIKEIDPNSRILMSPDGIKPANPFQDEPQFEESLQLSFHPVSGHQGRFVASHAMACIGVINDYQILRRARIWVPGVSSPGHPNDYINLFLDESKTWMRAQMTLDAVHGEELARRDNFYTKLKNDNYFWCFPPESEVRSIHRVIDFVHDKVKNAYELISREEKNKSLQGFFKELNDHSTNAFEFGKQFLAFLLYPGKKVNGNILADSTFDGRTYETGKLHNLLESATNVVIESYVADMHLTHERVHDRTADHKSLPPSDPSAGHQRSLRDSPQALVVRSSNNNNNTSAESKSDNSALDDAGGGQYLIEITEFEESTLRSVTYVVEMCDPNGIRWIIRKTFADFETLNNLVFSENRSQVIHLDRLQFPAKLGSKLFRDKEEFYTMGKQLQKYFLNLLYILANFSVATQNAVRNFMEVKTLVLSSGGRVLRRGEAVPNVFVSLKRDFAELLVATKEESKAGSSSKQTQALAEFRRIWGIEMALKVFEAYALLQRMATVLGWTLEINHFFISMFGNTLAFSKLPLRDIIMLQKDIMSKFLATCNELFDFACKVHADSKYKWHKNLQMVENQLNRVRFHIEKAMALIGLIDTEHLDYETQMRRLRDVHARFQPLMNRIDGSLGSIQLELSLPVTHHANENFLPPSQESHNNTIKNSPNAHTGEASSRMQAQSLDFGPSAADPRLSSGALALPRGSVSAFGSPPHDLLQLTAASKDSEKLLPDIPAAPAPTRTRTTSTGPTGPASRQDYLVEEPERDPVLPYPPSAGGMASHGHSPGSQPTISQNPMGYSPSGPSIYTSNREGCTVEEIEDDYDDQADGPEVEVDEMEIAASCGHSSSVCVIS